MKKGIWHRGYLLALGLITMFLAATTTPASATANEAGELVSFRTPALFDGEFIDMAQDWGEADACIVWAEALPTPECFRTEAERDARVAELEAKLEARNAGSLLSQIGSQAAMRGTNCSGYLKLYDGTFYSGASLYLRGRFQWFDLASFNFNNRTSSFKIGPCSAYFADLSGGGGAWYPTSQTQAYDTATTMVSGWNNDVSSLYIT